MSAPGGLFVDHKKGEVNELRTQLRDNAIDRDPKQKRAVLEKVIGYMTLGIDMSPLFSEMIMAAATKDLVQKKMAYLYLSNYARSQTELALLVINTLQKDCRDEDPMVRGLALRCLCSLSVKNLMDYVVGPIKVGMDDSSPYVRKTACLACIKLNQMPGNLLETSNLISALKAKVQDRDPQVVANAICTLNEVLACEGGFQLNKQTALMLLKRLHDFTEWSQCIVLEAISNYRPAGEAEVFDIMNYLDERLRHSNSGVVLATVKVFLHFTMDLPDVHRQVYYRLKSPLLTLMVGSTPELAYSCLCHIKLLAQRERGVFDDAYQLFFCRYNEPLYVKTLKLETLMLLACEKNCKDIVAELSSYVLDTDVVVAKKSVDAIGHIAIQIPASIEIASHMLLSFLETEIDYVVSATVVVAKDVLRKYPDRAPEYLPSVSKCYDLVQTVEAKAAVIWVIGEHGEYIDESPYLVEPLIDSYDTITDAPVKLELLTCAVKLFFKRAPEMQEMLGRLFEASTVDITNADVHDRAMLYYRLLQADVGEAQKVINAPRVAIMNFADDQDSETKDRIFEEFNSLAVIYGIPSKKFLPAVVVEADPEQALYDQPTDGGYPDEAQQIYDDEPQQEEYNSSPLQLASDASMPPAVFQQKWTQLQVLPPINLTLHGVRDADMITSRLGAANVKFMASGNQGGSLKFYLYSVTVGNTGLFLVEALVTPNGSMTATVKTDVPDLAGYFVDVFRGALADLAA